MVWVRHADCERGDTMIYTIRKWHLLLVDACQCQMLPDRSEDKLLVLYFNCVLMPVGACQC